MIDGQKAGLSETASPDPEVTPKAKRRIFSAAYKKKILAEVEAAAAAAALVRSFGAKGSILPR